MAAFQQKEQDVMVAIDKLLADKSVDQQTTKESLETVIEHIESLIDSLNDEPSDSLHDLV